MLDVTVKTLDGKNRSFSVPDDITVKQFKEKIAGSIDIGADLQRLIFQGRVLQDEKELNDYNVNGKTLHVVQRAPPSSRPEGATPDGATPNSQAPDGARGTQTFVGSFTLPSDVVDPNQVQNIVQNVLSGMGDVGRNARISTTSSGDGSSVDVHINLGQIGGPGVQIESQNRLRIAQRMLRLARQAVEKLENPPSSSSDDVDPMDTSPVDEAATGTLSSDNSAPQSSRTTPDTEPAPPPDPERSMTPDGTAQREGSSTEGTANRSGAPGGPSAQQPQHPRLSLLADLLQEVFDLNRRLQPFLDRYHEFLTQDTSFENDTEGARSTQHLCNHVSEVLHLVSHAYHSISDLIIDARQVAPRVLRANPVVQPTLIQQTIPVQAQISVAHVSPRGSPQVRRRAAGTATSTATPTPTSTSTPASSTTTSSSQQQPHAAGPFSMPFPMPPGMPFPGQLPGSGANLGGMGPGGNPYMFMEVGPQGIAISNISAQVVTSSGSSGTNTTSSSTPGSQQGAPTPQATPPGMPPGMPAGMPPGMAQMLPQNFLQNIVQMAQQAASTGQAPGQQVFVISQGNAMPVNVSGQGTPSTASSTLSSATSTSTSSSTPTTSTRRTAGTNTQTGTTAPPGGIPGAPRGNPFMFPGPRPQMLVPGLGLVAFVDPCLPCQSRFFARRRQGSGATPGGGAGQQPAGNQAPDIAGLVTNIVSSITGQAINLTGVAPASGAAMSTTATSTSSARTTPAPARAQQTPRPNPFAAMFNPTPRPAARAAPSQPPTDGAPAGDTPAIIQLRNLLQAGSQSTTSQSQSTPSSQSQSTDTSDSTASDSASRVPGMSMGDEMFAELVRGIGTSVSQAAMGQQSPTTINDFLNTLGQEVPSGNEGLLTDIFVCISQHLTIVDLMSIFCQQTAPLQRLLQPLHEFVRDRVLQNDEPTESNINQATERLVEEMLPQIEEICTDATVRENIDFPASVQEFLRYHLRTNCQLILNATENDDTFGPALLNNVRQIVHEFLVLVRYCLGGGQAAVENLVLANVRRISSDINPMIQQWMSGMTIQQVQMTMRNISFSEDQIEHYVVRCAEMASPQQPSSDSSFVSADDDTPVEASVSIAKETEACNSHAAGESEEMDVDNTIAPSPPRRRDDVQPHIDPEVRSHLPPPPQRDNDVAVVVGSESWHTQVDPEWVPVITQDIEQQRRAPPQAPYSDAYINGMPAKRRKLMNKASADASELTELRTIIPTVVQRAAEAAGAQPTTSPDDVARDAAGSSTLMEAFQQEMDDSIRKRLADDSDYIPEKYPNTETFYKKK